MVNYDRILGFSVGIGISVLVVACTGATFPYKHYPYDYAGHALIGATPQDDLPDSICAERTDNKRPCMIVLTDDFYQLEADYLKTKEALKDCQETK